MWLTDNAENGISLFLSILWLSGIKCFTPFLCEFRIPNSRINTHTHTTTTRYWLRGHERWLTCKEVRRWSNHSSTEYGTFNGIGTNKWNGIKRMAKTADIIKFIKIKESRKVRWENKLVVYDSCPIQRAHYIGTSQTSVSIAMCFCSSRPNIWSVRLYLCSSLHQNYLYFSCASGCWPSSSIYVFIFFA